MLEEILTYELRDFLMFSPRTYFRMVERYNESYWPFAAVAAGIVCYGAVGPRSVIRLRLVLLTLALLFGGIAVGFFLNRFDQIMWAAPYFAALFLIQSGLLSLAAWKAAGSFPAAHQKGAMGSAFLLLGGGVVLAAILFYPLIAWWSGRGLDAADWLGLMPDPTAAATIGILILYNVRYWWLYLVPGFWGAIGGLTLLAMDQAAWWATPVLCLGAPLVLWLGGKKRYN